MFKLRPIKLIAAVVPFGEASLCFALVAAFVVTSVIEPASGVSLAGEAGSRAGTARHEPDALGQMNQLQVSASQVKLVNQLQVLASQVKLVQMLAPGSRMGRAPGSVVTSSDGVLIQRIWRDEQGRKKYVFDRNGNLLEEYEYTEEFGDHPARVTLTNIKDGATKVHLRLRRKPDFYPDVNIRLFEYQLYDPQTNRPLAYGLDYAIIYHDETGGRVKAIEIRSVEATPLKRRGVGTTMVNWIAEMAQEENALLMINTTNNEELVRIAYRLIKDMLVLVPEEERDKGGKIKRKKWRFKRVSLDDALRLLGGKFLFEFCVKNGIPNPIRIVREKDGSIVCCQDTRVIKEVQSAAYSQTVAAHAESSGRFSDFLDLAREKEEVASHSRIAVEMERVKAGDEVLILVPSAGGKANFRKAMAAYDILSDKGATVTILCCRYNEFGRRMINAASGASAERTDQKPHHIIEIGDKKSAAAAAAAADDQVRRSSEIVFDEFVSNIEGARECLIETNPSRDVFTIASSLFEEAVKRKLPAAMVVYPVKKGGDFSERSCIGILKEAPKLIMRVTVHGIGRDREVAEGKASYEFKGQKLSGISMYRLLNKQITVLGMPMTNLDIYKRAVDIDYKRLRRRAAILKELFGKAVLAHVTKDDGTDFTIDCKGRKGVTDTNILDKDCALPYMNIPCGEAFVSPRKPTPEEPSRTSGRIFFNRLATLPEGCIMLKTPIEVVFENGFVKFDAQGQPMIYGGKEAEMLKAALKKKEEEIDEMLAKGAFNSEPDPKKAADEWKRNIYYIGEFAIGLNENAEISGSVLEAEKPLGTLHLAFGHDLDGQVQANSHLDMVADGMTIEFILEDGTKVKVMDKGELLIDELAPIGREALSTSALAPVSNFKADDFEGYLAEYKKQEGRGYTEDKDFLTATSTLDKSGLRESGRRIYGKRDKSDIYYSAAYAYEKRGWLEEAIAHYQRARDFLKKESRLQGEPNRELEIKILHSLSTCNMELGWIAKASGKENDAEEYFRKSRSACAEAFSIATKADLDIFIYLQYAIASWQLGNIDEALRVCGKIDGMKVRGDSGLFQAYIMRWLIYSKKGDAETARAHRDAADRMLASAANKGKLSWYHYYLGGHLFLVGDFKMAMAHLEKAVKLDDKDENKWYWLGLVRLGVGEDGPALLAFQEANRQVPYWAECTLLQIEILFKHKRFFDAIPKIKHLFKIMKSGPAMRNRFLAMYKKAGEPAELKETISSLLEERKPAPAAAPAEVSAGRSAGRLTSTPANDVPPLAELDKATLAGMVSIESRKKASEINFDLVRRIVASVKVPNDDLVVIGEKLILRELAKGSGNAKASRR